MVEQARLHQVRVTILKHFMIRKTNGIRPIENSGEQLTEKSDKIDAIRFKCVSKSSIRFCFKGIVNYTIQLA